MTKRGDTKLLQVLVRQARENRLVYVILTEDRLVLREAQAPQPTSNIHDGRPNPMGQRNLGLGETACPGPLGVIRVAARHGRAVADAWFAPEAAKISALPKNVAIGHERRSNFWKIFDLFKFRLLRIICCRHRSSG